MVVCVCVCVYHLSIIIILVTTFMQGIYNYIPKINHVSRVYSVAAVLKLQLVLQVMLFFLLLLLLLLLLKHVSVYYFNINNSITHIVHLLGC